jgi:carboxyvinyl-carboxyphosphonate phosphorylmutase
MNAITTAAATAKRLAFRQLLQGAGCIRPATTFDPLSALAAEEIGYAAGILAGSTASLSVLGAPDLAVLTLTDLVEQARRICRVSGLPLLVDGDHGYGNALNVRRAVVDLEAAGISALMIEDTLLPAAFGTAEGASLISIAELSGKLRAAVDARTDPAFVLIGRTHAGLAGGLDELLARQAAIEATGVDAFFVAGLKKPADLDALAAAATLPIVLGSAVPGLDIAALAARKVRICLQGHGAFYEGVKAMYASLAASAGGGSLGELPPKALVERLNRSELHAQWARDFLK